MPVAMPVVYTLSLTGNVEANPDKVVRITTLVSGIVSQANFTLGDRVTRGSVLAEFRSPEFSELRSSLQTVESHIKVAERKLLAAQAMYADNIASKNDLLEAQSEVEIHRSEKQKMLSNLTIYGASSGKDVFQIKAPVSGIITAKSIAAGTRVSPETGTLYTISDLSEVWVMVNIHATNVRNIQPGTEVRVSALAYPDEIFSGTISSVSQVLDPEEKVLKARVKLANKDLKLKPGMLVDVVASHKTMADALSIPASAVIFEDNRYFVVVYRNHCDLAAREIEVISQNKETVFISSGLEPSDKVITKNPLVIYEQLRSSLN